MLCASGSPSTKSQRARVVGIARSSLYVHCQRRSTAKALAVRMEAAQEKDDTMGQRKLAALLGTGKHGVRRVMQKYGLAARGKREARRSTLAKRLRLRPTGSAKTRLRG